jgi:DNA polymerase alpha-associated DNA helicase A
MSKGRLGKQPPTGNEQVPLSQTSEAAAENHAEGENGHSSAWAELEGIDITKRPRLSPPRSLERTLFDRLERLYGPGIKRVLNTQYRWV